MIGIGVRPVQRMHEVETGTQHCLKNFEDGEIGLIRRMQRAIRDGASKVWRLCTQLLSPSSPEVRQRQWDHRMLSLLEREEALSDTLQKTEKAMELLPVASSSWSQRGTTKGTMEYLQTVKTRVAEELQAINHRRIVTFNQALK